MEQKKSPQADMEQRRTTAFLLGLAIVLSLFYVALEWNSISTPGDGYIPLDLSQLTHESELVPMQNLETVKEIKEKTEDPKSEQLRVVDDDIELEDLDDEEQEQEDEELLQQLDEDDEVALEAMGTDPNNPLNFRVVEELPQFPGGAVEFLKWLTKNLRYPAAARQRKIQGKVLAVFYVEKTGKVTGIKVTKSLTPECDREVVRVLGIMPDWTPGIQNDKPCRTKVCIPVVFKL